MKKLTTILALFILVTTTAVAQKGLHAAFKLVPQTTWMFNGDDSDAGDEWNYVTTFGFAMGPSINYHFTDGFGAGIELIFSKQGQKFETFGVESYKRLNYFKLPVLLFFNTNSEEVVYFQGYFGPSFGFLTSAKVLNENGDEVADIEEFHKSTNVSIVLGFGLGFNIHENFKIHFGLRFDAAPGDAEDKDNLLFVGSDRPATRNINGGIEFGFVFVLPTGR